MGSSTIDGASYGLDNGGNRTSKTDWLANVTSNYAYDATYELIQVTQGTNTIESYGYDPVGNRTSSLGVSPYSYNNSNELTSSSAASYTYDNNGNTLTKTDSTGTTAYAWDFENRLSSVTLPGNGGTISFKYDPFRRRIYKSSPTGTSVFAYEGQNLIEETNVSGGVVARYAQGTNIDEPLVMLRSGTASYYDADGVGSVTSLTNSSGASIETYSYDSFGKLVASSGSLVNPFQYTGREFDSETGLYYYRARYYDRAVGRFISEDPAGFAGGFDFYDYSDNDPTDSTDPTGLMSGPFYHVVQHFEEDIDTDCPTGPRGRPPAGACTRAFARMPAIYKCIGKGWKAEARLDIYGDMYVFDGRWPYKGRSPVDHSVTSAETAVSHEYNAHLTPATNSVIPKINKLESRTFKTEADCKKEVKKTADGVFNDYNLDLQETQREENMQ